MLVLKDTIEEFDNKIIAEFMPTKQEIADLAKLFNETIKTNYDWQASAVYDTKEKAINLMAISNPTNEIELPEILFGEIPATELLYEEIKEQLI